MTGLCGTVAVVDDDDDLRSALVQALELDGLQAIGFANGDAALAAIDDRFAGVVVTDLRMPGLDGSALFARLAEIDPDLPVLIITGHGDLPTAVDLMRRGAYDFISKPFSSERLLPTVRRALEKRALVLENRALRNAASENVLGWAGTSADASRLRESMRRLADADRPVLLLGETGTGKSHAAGILHRLSRRARQPLVTIDCGTVPAQDAEAYLFGHVSGALPGANMPRTGALRRADRGTIILDRVDRLPPTLFGPLIRMVESRSITPVGGDMALPFDTAIIATAGPDLADQVAAGRFDRGLYYRLAGQTLALPALRERPDDVAALFGAFLHEAADRAGLPVPHVPPSALARLRTHTWPGNARELAAFADEVVLGLSQPAHATSTPASEDLRESVARYEAECIRAALVEAGGDVEAARARLGLPRKTLYDKMARHEIVAADYRRR